MTTPQDDILRTQFLHERNNAFESGGPVFTKSDKGQLKEVLNIGWTCPRCGRGNSPTAQTCSCVPFETKVTC